MIHTGYVTINRGHYKGVTAHVQRYLPGKYRLELPTSATPVEEQAPHIRGHFLWIDETGFTPVADYQI